MLLLGGSGSLALRQKGRDGQASRHRMSGNANGGYMDVKKLAEDSLRKMLQTYPYEKITVSMICEDTGMARKTFYAHFDNKDAIVQEIFVRDVIKPQRDMRSLLPSDVRRSNSSLLTRKLYDAILEDANFYYALVGPLKGKDDVFLRVATNAIYQLASSVSLTSPQCQSEQEADYAAYFFASSQAMLLQKWISERYSVDTEVLASWYEKLAVGYWHQRFPSED